VRKICLLLFIFACLPVCLSACLGQLNLRRPLHNSPESASFPSWRPVSLLALGGKSSARAVIASRPGPIVAEILEKLNTRVPWLYIYWYLLPCLWIYPELDPRALFVLVVCLKLKRSRALVKWCSLQCSYVPFWPVPSFPLELLRIRPYTRALRMFLWGPRFHASSTNTWLVEHSFRGACTLFQQNKSSALTA